MPDRCLVCKQFTSTGRIHQCDPHRPKRTKTDAKWRSQSDESKQYRAAYMKRWREQNPGYAARVQENRTAERASLRYSTLAAYGGDPPVCACCKESELSFLTLDHVEGGGNAARKIEGHKGGTQQYRRLRKLGWPEGYRVLCWNCNAAFGLYGRCPHSEDKPLVVKDRVFRVAR